MTTHRHEWTPIVGHVAQYACHCGATGYRRRDGQIVAHAVSRVYREVTVQSPDGMSPVYDGEHRDMNVTGRRKGHLT